MAICATHHYRNPERPRHTDDGYIICRGCVAGLRKDATALPKLYDDLTYLHTAQRGRPQARVSGSTERRAPISIAAAIARSDMLELATDWADYAHQQAASVAPLSRTVASATRWIAGNAEWCARQEWAPNLVDAFRQIRAKAIQLIAPNPGRTFAIEGSYGICVRYLCEGRMWVTFPDEEDQAPRISCDTCGHVYPVRTWYGIGHLIRFREGAAA